MKTYSDLESEWKEEIISTHERIKLEYSLLQSGDINKSDISYNPGLMTLGYSASVFFKNDYGEFDDECSEAISGSKKYLCVSIEMISDSDWFYGDGCIEGGSRESFLEVFGYKPVDKIDFEEIFLENDLIRYIREYLKNEMDVNFINLDYKILKLLNIRK